MFDITPLLAIESPKNVSNFVVFKQNNATPKKYLTVECLKVSFDDFLVQRVQKKER